MPISNLHSGKKAAADDATAEVLAYDDDSDESRPDLLLHVILFGASIAVLATAFALRVQDGEYVMLPFLDIPIPGTCTFRQTVGHPCPGCGLTRCFVSLAHGNMAAAWQFNPAGVLFFAVVAVQIPFRAIQILRVSRGLPEIRFGRFELVPLTAVIVVLVGQWLVRLLLG